MALLIPNAGEGLALENFLNKSAPQNQTMLLYKSNTTPAETDTTATYTEATFTGYAAKSITGTSWTVTPGAPTTAAYAQQSFASTANQTTEAVYGYVFKQTTSGTIMWAERFSDGPYNITNNGDTINVTPQITLE